ncbi:MAG: ribonuclease J [Caldiserica bacterium]|jgi:ribonuclease J|nr:ribonuclease J [Caldisericota bacterium]MDH7562790.1 ribonuclease J [Caldisericota bacterium]
MNLEFIALGGLGEIGKNMMAFKFEDRLLVVDAGVKFPDEKTPGVDLIIPDYSYLVQNREKVLGILLTHGHEDHVGALPFLLQEVPAPVFGTDITLGLASGRINELGIDWEPNPVNPGDQLELGPFSVEFLQVTHSVPGCLGLAIKTSLGTVIYSGDFKFDQTPVDGRKIDLARFAELSRQGVLCLLCDSTNAEEEGFAPSEQKVKAVFEGIFRSAPHRIIVTTFASNVHRIQQIISTAYEFNRKVLIDGMSLVRVVNVAQELGYLRIPEGTLIKAEDISRYPRKSVLIITTGSQGEPLSALSRIASGEHKKIKLEPGDTVVFSADPIPGNETLVAETIDNLFRQKAEVIYGPLSDAHVSGHGYSEDIKLMINLTRPRYFIPVHGEYRHLVKSGRLALEMGIKESQIFILENGDQVSFSPGKAFVKGRIPISPKFVDGLSVDDLSSVVLRERQHLGQEGFVAFFSCLNRKIRKIIGPEIHFKGFLPERMAQEIREELRSNAILVLNQCMSENLDLGACKQKVKEVLQRYFSKKLRKRPFILVDLLEENEGE